MGTWGAGNLDSDDALDELELIVDGETDEEIEETEDEVTRVVHRFANR